MRRRASPGLKSESANLRAAGRWLVFHNAPTGLFVHIWNLAATSTSATVPDLRQIVSFP